MKNNSLINNLKVRLSYGKSGNNNIGNYTHLASVSAGSYLFGSQQVTGSRVGLPNPFLTWEGSEEHTSELQSLMRHSYAVFCLKKNKKNTHIEHIQIYIIGQQTRDRLIKDIPNKKTTKIKYTHAQNHTVHYDDSIQHQHATPAGRATILPQSNTPVLLTN